MSTLQFTLLSHSFPHSIPHPKLRHDAPRRSLLHGITTTGTAPNSLRVVLPERSLRKRGRGAVCFAAPPVTAVTLQWVSAVSAAVLMLAKGTAIQKSFLVPLVALQAPESIISWIKGEYGMWTAFLALLVRLFYFIPGELDLPFLTMLLVIVAPYQALTLRGTQGGAIVSLAIAGYLAFQHFSRVGSLRRAFDQGAIVATLGIICVALVPCFFLF
ncbi:cold-regulated 413 inner membrane protein 1, chloroplastic-like [Typha angustifolia]|uniref:cold-regulated 413 inner membrane protein 1, chloroplastic-like n=1 Tax=Typha angustifolia TaxID=59011 RepID=UPI003C2C8C97